MQKTDKKPAAGADSFRRFRRASNIERMLDGWDYALIMGIRFRKPKPRR